MMNNELKVTADIGFRDFVSLCEKWLENYPADIFDGRSGDPGPVFVCALRAALKAMNTTTGENDV